MSYFNEIQNYRIDSPTPANTGTFDKEMTKIQSNQLIDRFTTYKNPLDVRPNQDLLLNNIVIIIVDTIENIYRKLYPKTNIPPEISREIINAKLEHYSVPKIKKLLNILSIIIDTKNENFESFKNEMTSNYNKLHNQYNMLFQQYQETLFMKKKLEESLNYQKIETQRRNEEINNLHQNEKNQLIVKNQQLNEALSSINIPTIYDDIHNGLMLQLQKCRDELTEYNNNISKLAQDIEKEQIKNEIFTDEIELIKISHNSVFTNNKSGQDSDMNTELLSKNNNLLKRSEELRNEMNQLKKRNQQTLDDQNKQNCDDMQTNNQKEYTSNIDSDITNNNNIVRETRSNNRTLCFNSRIISDGYKSDSPLGNVRRPSLVSPIKNTTNYPKYSPTMFNEKTYLNYEKRPPVKKCILSVRNSLDHSASPSRPSSHKNSICGDSSH